MLCERDEVPLQFSELQGTRRSDEAEGESWRACTSLEIELAEFGAAVGSHSAAARDEEYQVLGNGYRAIGDSDQVVLWRGTISSLCCQATTSNGISERQREATEQL